jgi:hypothetical protein
MPYAGPQEAWRRNINDAILGFLTKVFTHKSLSPKTRLQAFSIIWTVVYLPWLKAENIDNWDGLNLLNINTRSIIFSLASMVESELDSPVSATDIHKKNLSIVGGLFALKVLSCVKKIKQGAESEKTIQILKVFKSILPPDANIVVKGKIHYAGQLIENAITELQKAIQLAERGPVGQEEPGSTRLTIREVFQGAPALMPSDDMRPRLTDGRGVENAFKASA